MRIKGAKVAGVGVALGAVVLAGCSGGDDDAARARFETAGVNHSTTSAPSTTAPGGPRIRLASALQAFDKCSAFLGYVKAEAGRVVGPYGIPGRGGYRRDVMVAEGRALATTGQAEDSSGASASSPAPPAAPGVDYSETNVQEAGVDEPDLVKTDGRVMVTVGQRRLHLFDVRGSTPKAAGHLDLGEGYGEELLLAGDRVLVIGQGGYDIRPMPVEDGRAAASPTVDPNAGPSTRVTVVDVSDLDAPKVAATLQLEGGYVAARLIDGKARLVLESSNPGPTPVMATGAEDEPRALAANRAAIARSSVNDWLPSYALERPGRASTEGQMVACDSVYRPPTFSGVSTVSVVTVDPADPKPDAGASVLGSGGTVYASPTSVYIATNRWADMQVSPAVGGPEIAPAPNRKVTTAIHRFDIDAAGPARYRATGEVRGFVLNQFSMSELDGRLRVATTLMPTWFAPAEGQTSESFVTVLAERSGALVPVGTVGGLGRGERIYAVRFIGALGYVVTFRQVDPLYVIDLRDPTKPAVRGELKISGYSAYLHPVGDGFLLGVGQDASDDGRVQGLQASLFDVRDPAKPSLLHRTRLSESGGHSAAEFDHHAFLYWARTQLLVLPLTEYPQTFDGSKPQQAPFVGAVGVSVDRGGGFGTARRISHAGRPVGSPSGASSGSDAPCNPEMGCYQVPPEIRRSLVVRGALLTVSEGGVLVSDLDSLADRAWLPF